MNLGKEDERTEFKRSTSELKEGVASMASILNKHAKGTLYFGVRNDGEVVGQDASEITLREVSQAIGNYIEPRVFPEISLLTTPEGKRYVRVEFEGSEGPYACDGRYRIRVADEDVKMTSGLLRAQMLEQANRLDPWDARLSMKTVDDVDERALRAFVERGRERGRISFEYSNAASVLESLGLLREGKLTNTADILFTPQQYVGLKMGILESHARTEALDLHQEIGTVFELIDRAEYYILNNIRRRLVITGKRTRDEVPEIPRKAIREALVNAFAHRVWYQDGYVQVDIYYDAVEIINPGWFIPEQDPEAHLAGLSTNAQTRNKNLTQALFRSGDIESYGMGIRAMKELCDKAGVRVEYQNTPDGTKLVFHRRDAFEGGTVNETQAENGTVNGTVNETQAENGTVNGTVNETQAENGTVNGTVNETQAENGTVNSKRHEAILLFLEKHPTSSYEEIAAALNISRRTVARELKRLVQTGSLQRVGSDKRGEWRIIRTTQNDSA